MAVTATVIGETLAERAYRLLEDEIVQLQLPPGRMVTEQELATRLSIGRTPVREAIQRLVADRLLIVFPRKGIVVADLNPIDVLLALDVRAVLERLVVVAATGRAGPAERAGLAVVVDGLTRAAAAGAVEGYLRADKEFDRLVSVLAANPFAARALAPLQSMSRRAWFYFRRDADLGAAAERHDAIMKAIAAGDQPAAAAAVDALIDHVRIGLRTAIAI
jgi:DNA-binding GntR family transcriptional regulator